MPGETSEGEQNTQAAAEGCPVRMDSWEGKRCGRQLHHGPPGVDAQRVCLMHSKDAAKSDGKLYKMFMEEFESILAEAGDDYANFYKFIFPTLYLSERPFACSCDFSSAVFTEDAYFLGATFAKDADFSSATFTKNADFSRTTLGQNADFSRATFTRNADFLLATFMQNADFFRATFTQNANFSDATFTQKAVFSSATFMQNADFSSAAFTQDIGFRSATFKQYLNFYNAICMQNAYFSRATFKQTLNLSAAKFLSAVTFRHTEFESTKADIPSAMFALASFEKPDAVIFDNVNLSNVSFHNCDVTRFWFTSSVEWGQGDGRQAVLFEEVTTPEQAEKLGIWTGGQRTEERKIVGGHRDHKAIAQIYQQLKKNYDARLDYWTANNFHFGEMEMQRLDLPTSGPLLPLRQWWHPRISLVALYRWGSSYGNSYQRPLWWMLSTLVLFTFLFPLVGLVHTVGSGSVAQVWRETFASAWHAGTSAPQKVFYLLAVLLHSLITSVDSASFQRNLDYSPAYPWGRVLAILETLLTSTLVALFFLALRRQFRR